MGQGPWQLLSQLALAEWPTCWEACSRLCWVAALSRRLIVNASRCIPFELVSRTDGFPSHLYSISWDSSAVGDVRGYDRGRLLLMLDRTCVRRVRYFCLLYRMSGDSSAVVDGR